MKACRAFDPGSNPGPGVNLRAESERLAKVLAFSSILVHIGRSKKYAGGRNISLLAQFPYFLGLSECKTSDYQ